MEKQCRLVTCSTYTSNATMDEFDLVQMPKTTMSCRSYISVRCCHWFFSLIQQLEVDWCVEYILKGICVKYIVYRYLISCMHVILMWVRSV
jgi:hypothetical protein